METIPASRLAECRGVIAAAGKPSSPFIPRFEKQASIWINRNFQDFVHGKDTDHLD
jgi:hypothetical protein